MLGQLQRIQNKDEKPGANHMYWRLVVKFGGGYETLLITDYELDQCRDRAKKNPEDLVTLSWWQRVRAFIAS